VWAGCAPSKRPTACRYRVPQILTEREEKCSIAIASKLPFSEWGTIIREPRLVAAIVDRHLTIETAAPQPNPARDHRPCANA
jgi:hypothetical protein